MQAEKMQSKLLRVLDGVDFWCKLCPTFQSKLIKLTLMVYRIRYHKGDAGDTDWFNPELSTGVRRLKVTAPE